MTPKDLLFVVYLVISWILVLYGTNLYYLLFKSIRNHNLPLRTALNPAPTVTIQLPVYNEMYVVRRLVTSICKIDYPKSNMEIQVLDDSNDDTVTICNDVVEEFRKQGYDIEHIRRGTRSGFKAGALQNGLSRAKGEFIAIFDADFVPNPDFLTQTLPYFASREIGLVQAKWGHLNEQYSSLTKAQALSLDAHFLIEQRARSYSALFMNFNGTAGIWRKECLEDVGGWKASLAEDLDISLRAQLQGWKLVFLPELICPAELPVQMNASKRQQFRWAKGSIECAIRHTGTILFSKFPLETKFQAFMQLTRHVIHPLIIAQFIILPILMLAKFDLAPVTAILTQILLGPPIYCYALTRLYGNQWLKKVPAYFYLLLFGAGISVNNSGALAQALLRKKSDFLRTPKFAVRGRKDEWKGKQYALPFTATALGESLMVGWGVITILVALLTGNFFLLPHIVILTLGFAYVASLTVLHSVGTRTTGAG